MPGRCRDVAGPLPGGCRVAAVRMPVVYRGVAVRCRARLFAWMMKSPEGAMEFFKLPTDPVIELGSQLRI
jgi:K+ transporter